MENQTSEYKITVAALRHLLFVGNQNMTVQELRSKLFDEKNQDFEITESTIRQLLAFK